MPKDHGAADPATAGVHGYDRAMHACAPAAHSIMQVQPGRPCSACRSAPWRAGGQCRNRGRDGAAPLRGSASGNEAAAPARQYRQWRRPQRSRCARQTAPPSRRPPRRRRETGPRPSASGRATATAAPRRSQAARVVPRARSSEAARPPQKEVSAGNRVTGRSQKSPVERRSAYHGGLNEARPEPVKNRLSKAQSQGAVRSSAINCAGSMRGRTTAY